MQELITMDRGMALQSGTVGVERLRGTTSDTVVSELEEAFHDLSELGYLIDDLSDFATEDAIDSIDLHLLSQGWFYTNFRQSLEILKARHRRLVDLLERASRWGSSTQLSSLLDSVRREYIAIKNVLRVSYRQRGTMLCASDWQSPIYSSSVPLGTNRLMNGIAEHSLDYKRDGHLDALSYEEAFVAEYGSHLGSNRLKAYLANSGMAAFSTVLHWLAHEVDLGNSALALQPMYFENLHLARGFFPNLFQLQNPAENELLTQLRTRRPSVVFCDAVTNCGDVLAHDYETVLSWAAYEADHKVAVVIDTTCLPLFLLPTGMLESLPENVSVILVESLAKHHQFGMDAVTGGVIVAHMDDTSNVSFSKTRARLGTNIADGSVGSLPKPNREKLTRRMQRHSRNTRVIAQALEEMSSEQDGVIESVSWLNDGAAGAIWFAGSCLTLRLRKGYRSIEIYKNLEARVLELAKEINHPIAFGTSFGFDVSRMYVTAPATRFEEPFLRISVGSETISQVLTLIDILAKSNVELRQSKTVAPEKDKRVTVREARVKDGSNTAVLPANVEKPGLRASVFLGEEGLRDYLCPANYAASPLIELPGDLNPFRQDGVRLLAKMVPLVPLMNIKSIPAYSMLSKAAERGELNGVEQIIESSSSNTVLSLSVIARLFGVDSTSAIVDHSIAPSLTRMLRLFGIEILMHPAAGHELFGKMEPRSERATNIGKQPGWLNPGQYSNPDNPDGFARWLAPDIWAQTQGRINVLSCGLGTCGTMVGVSRGLRDRNPDIQVLACCPVPGQAVPGPREQSLLHDVTFPWQGVANSCFELTTDESFKASVKLLRRGILGGPSSGMNYAGALRYWEQEKESGRLKARVDAQGEQWCVFLCCDSPLPHVDEYYDALGDEFFPDIHPVPEVDRSISNNAD